MSWHSLLNTTKEEKIKIVCKEAINKFCKDLSEIALYEMDNGTFIDSSSIHFDTGYKIVNQGLFEVFSGRYSNNPDDLFLNLFVSYYLSGSMKTDFYKFFTKNICDDYRWGCIMSLFDKFFK